MEKYVAEDTLAALQEEEYIYELKSIVIHSGGGAYAGHYYAFIKDDLK